jgi:hypothetical protein
VTSPQTLKEIVKGGWSDPHFYYNRVADDVAFSSALVLSPEGGDENLLRRSTMRVGPKPIVRRASPRGSPTPR